MIDTLALGEVSIIDTFRSVSIRFSYLVLTNQISVFLVAILQIQTVLVGHAQQLFRPSLKQLHALSCELPSSFSTSNSSLFLASKLPCKCDVREPHSQINTEQFSSHGVSPAFGFIFSCQVYTLLICCHVHVLPKRCHGATTGNSYEARVVAQQAIYYDLKFLKFKVCQSFSLVQQSWNKSTTFMCQEFNSWQ